MDIDISKYRGDWGRTGYGAKPEFSIAWLLLCDLYNNYGISLRMSYYHFIYDRHVNNSHMLTLKEVIDFLSSQDRVIVFVIVRIIFLYETYSFQ